MRAIRLIFLAILVASNAAISAASTVHHVRFSQEAVLLVWNQGTLIGQGESVQLAGLSPVSADSLTGGGQLVSANAEGSKTLTLSIASNTGFALRTRGGIDANELKVRVLETGPNAQLVMEEAVSSQMIFMQSQRTALHPGSPLSQAITLEVSWSGETAPNLYAQAL